MFIQNTPGWKGTRRNMLKQQDLGGSRWQQVLRRVRLFLSRYVVHPLSTKRFRWDSVVLFGMAYTGIMMPLQFADFSFVLGLGWLRWR